MLGTLAKWLMILGHDVTYYQKIDDGDLVAVARREGRTILTCDRRLVKRRGAKDHQILPYCGKNNLCLVTLDRRILATPALAQLIAEHGVGVFFVSTGKKETPSPWMIFKILVRHWDDMCRLSDTERRPFSLLVRPTGGIQPYKRNKIRRR